VRPRTKVTIDSLHEVVREKSTGTKILDLCLQVVQSHTNIAASISSKLYLS